VRKALLPLLVLLGSVLAGCGQPSTGPPPIMSTVVCGVTLSRQIGEPFIYDITARGFNPRSVVTGPTDVYVRVAAGCKQGSHVTITPADAFRVIKTARAADHLRVALLLEAVRAVPSTLVAYQQGRVVGVLRLDIPKDEVCSATDSCAAAVTGSTPIPAA